MKLYVAPGTISIAVAIALEEANVPHDLVRVDFKSGEQTKPAYQSINPKGRVPALDIDGAILTETGALLEYIAAVAPDAGLVPDDAIEAAKMREVMFYLATTMHVNHAHRMRGSRWADDPVAHQSMAAKVPQTMTESATYIENTARLDPFTLGSQMSLADPYLYMVCSWLPGDGVSLDLFPRISAFLAVMEARASVAKMREIGLL